MDFTDIKKNLEKRGYKVSCFATKEEAASYLNEKIDGKTVGIGGCATAKEMGLGESLQGHNQVFWHWNGDPRESAMATDVYISSVNGIARTGEIVNIDGTGNRLASTLFGHKKLYLVVGSNKIADDLDGAIWRARNVAAPKNMARLGWKTPCHVKADHCYNCKSPERGCKALLVFWEKPMGIPYQEVVLVDEDLGY